MSQRSADLLKDALSLPDDERASLTDELLASFDPEPGESDALDDPEFLAELERRAEELRTNPEAGIPWETVKAMR